MKIPEIPPDYLKILSQMQKEEQLSLFQIMEPTDQEGRYLHWSKLKYLEPPKGFTSETWWVSLKLSRKAMQKELPLHDKQDKPFSYCVTNKMEEELHWLDLNTAGHPGKKERGTDEQVLEHLHDQGTKTTYLVRSLVEEAISSSQLEGATTTRNVAKEMLREQRDAKDHSEQMILNNYQAMLFIKEFCNEKLTPEIIFRLHEILTQKTLDDSEKAGQLRSFNDDISVVEARTQELLHTPPNASQLPERLKVLCDFANGKSESHQMDKSHQFDKSSSEKKFLHPVVRAIILHFMLAYDHPFVDGNGRTARALFYWSMASQNYWLMEFISISKIIKKAPAQYGKAYLHTETDSSDVTYFIIQQLEVIRQAIDEIHHYLIKKQHEIENAEELLSNNRKLKGKLNYRQLGVLKHALKHPGFTYKISQHQNSHGITYETARKDLLTMADKLKLLLKVKEGRKFVFIAPSDLDARVRG